jgi:hypothetical protein
LLVNHKGEVKITDFGVSAVLASSIGQRDTFVGTYNYMAVCKNILLSSDCLMVIMVIRAHKFVVIVFYFSSLRSLSGSVAAPMTTRVMYGVWA